MPRIAIIKKEWCHGGTTCPYICINVCPVNRAGKECIVINQTDKKVIIDEKLCIGCGICPKKCPYEAIEIINLPEELKKPPIHRYGRNGFHLYNLPIPIFGKVVGIVGKNGIGKTTAIRVLSGALKPNLGEEKEATYEEIISFFRGTEAQSFFEKLNNGEIKVALKPQSVDLIPKQFSGKVSDLLKKADEKKRFDEIVDMFEIRDIIDNDIKNISGGELQLIAIAATFLKDANLYIFDEPTSYLDIKQRLRISNLIRNLADEKTAVLVVDHDLLILDYMTDLIHIMYGKEDSFGIVSAPYTTKAGLNIFLDGYIKETNMRFREKPIKFYAKPPVEVKKEGVIVSWSNLKKRLDGFELDSEEGKMYKAEIVGILGPNGIGKTTFVKILAGVLKQDSGTIDKNVKIAYKPQHIITESNELVANVLKDAILKYEVQLMRPLGLKKLLTKRLNELSGGEIQRVAIASCLSADADLYLLDEPSAHLDVEQRLVVSKIIKEMMELKQKSCLVVDHDIIFIDYLSERLMVFEGKPAIRGIAKGPFSMLNGMNLFLKGIGLTMRRDVESARPRINKIGSRLDIEQKESGRLYYG